MRIAINCRSFLKSSPTGIGRYAFNLVTSLGALAPEHTYRLYAPRRLFDVRRRLPPFKAACFSPCYDVFRRGVDAVCGPVDLYHAPSPEDLSAHRSRVVVTVHDLIHKTFPEGHTPETCATAERQIQTIVQRADKIICCSRSTMDDLQKFFSVDAHKVCWIHQGVDKTVFYPLSEAVRAPAVRRWFSRGIGGPFLLFVGTLEPRKNLGNLLEAFAQLRARRQFTGQLVCVGMKGWMTDDLDQRLTRLEIREAVVFPGYISDGDLRELYNLAEAFVFPSFYEGFGFPIVEAMACGAPVVTSNTSACAEIASDAALTVDPRDASAIARALAHMTDDAVTRAAYSRRALARAKDFSFEKTAEETLAVYQEVMERS